jgi:transglutaminase-like putative cysteine protease
MTRYEKAPPTPLRIKLERIPQGYSGTQRTVARMQALIRQGVKDFYVRQKAIDILFEKGVQPKDYLGEVKALFEWVQQNVRYTKDAFRLEILHSARRMLELRAGDCDDMSILLGAMLEAIGHPVRLVIVGPDILRPDLFTHVYIEVYHKGRWIPLDATMPFPMGWAPRVFNKKVIPINRRPDTPSPGIGNRPSTQAMTGQTRRTGRPFARTRLRPVRPVRARPVASTAGSGG